MTEKFNIKLFNIKLKEISNKKKYSNSIEYQELLDRQLINSVLEDDFSKIKKLIEKGANPNNNIYNTKLDISKERGENYISDFEEYQTNALSISVLSKNLIFEYLLNHCETDYIDYTSLNSNIVLSSNVEAINLLSEKNLITSHILKDLIEETITHQNLELLTVLLEDDKVSEYFKNTEFNALTKLFKKIIEESESDINFFYSIPYIEEHLFINGQKNFYYNNLVSSVYGTFIYPNKSHYVFKLISECDFNIEKKDQNNTTLAEVLRKKNIGQQVDQWILEKNIKKTSQKQKIKV